LVGVKYSYNDPSYPIPQDQLSATFFGHAAHVARAWLKRGVESCPRQADFVLDLLNGVSLSMSVVPVGSGSTSTTPDYLVSDCDNRTHLRNGLIYGVAPARPVDSESHKPQIIHVTHSLEILTVDQFLLERRLVNVDARMTDYIELLAHLGHPQTAVGIRQSLLVQSRRLGMDRVPFSV
jgi:hypothetical protein